MSDLGPNLLFDEAWRPREATAGDEVAGAMVMLVTRHLLVEARADVVRRLVGAKAN